MWSSQLKLNKLNKYHRANILKTLTNALQCYILGSWEGKSGCWGGRVSRRKRRKRRRKRKRKKGAAEANILDKYRTNMGKVLKRGVSDWWLRRFWFFSAETFNSGCDTSNSLSLPSHCTWAMLWKYNIRSPVVKSRKIFFNWLYQTLWFGSVWIWSQKRAEARMKICIFSL